jgi:hypothetical protein
MLYLAGNDPDYNLLVRSAPRVATSSFCPRSELTHEPPTTSSMADLATAALWYRWHVVCIPHLHASVWAGIKSYGDFIPSLGTPEDWSAQLRQHLGHQPDHVSQLGTGQPIELPTLPLPRGRDQREDETLDEREPAQRQVDARVLVFLLVGLTCLSIWRRSNGRGR